MGEAYGKRGHFVFVKCSFCGAQGKTYSTEDALIGNWAESNPAIDAINAWNTRNYSSGEEQLQVRRDSQCNKSKK